MVVTLNFGNLHRNRAIGISNANATEKVHTQGLEPCKKDKKISTHLIFMTEEKHINTKLYSESVVHQRCG